MDMKKLFVMLLTVSASVVAFAQSASFREFTYNGKTYRGEVLQVVPATVKIRS